MYDLIAGTFPCPKKERRFYLQRDAFAKTGSGHTRNEETSKQKPHVVFLFFSFLFFSFLFFCAQEESIRGEKTSFLRAVLYSK